MMCRFERVYKGVYVCVTNVRVVCRELKERELVFVIGGYGCCH